MTAVGPHVAATNENEIFSLNNQRAAVACRLLKAKRVVPMHFGTFPPLTGRPEQLQKLISDTATEVWALEPGKPVDW